MLYFKARWLHDGTQDDPAELLSEIDDARNEMRKVDVFSNGRLQAACERFATGETWLSLEPIPPLDEINGHAQFEAVEIEHHEFEAIWAAALAQRDD